MGGIINFWHGLKIKGGIYFDLLHFSLAVRDRILERVHAKTNRSIPSTYLENVSKKTTKIYISLRTPEQILRHHSSFLGPVKIFIKTHDGEPVLFRHRILVSIVKIQMKSPGSIGNL